MLASTRTSVYWLSACFVYSLPCLRLCACIGVCTHINVCPARAGMACPWLNAASCRCCLSSYPAHPFKPSLAPPSCLTVVRRQFRGGYRISPRGGRSLTDWCLNAVEKCILNGETPPQRWAPAPAPTPWIRAWSSAAYDGITL